MKLVAHASPLDLEAELLDRIAAVKNADPLAPVLVVVPSRRLSDHVKGRLAARFGAVLGVSVVHHGVLAARVLEHAGAAPRRVLGDDLLAYLFDDVLQRTPAGPVRDFVRDHPQAAAAMLKALTDLREAGIEPAIATKLLSGDEAQTANLYVRWTAALDEIEGGGRAIDDAGLVRAAIPLAPDFARRFAAIFHHGAYDLIGLRIQLVRALNRGRELTFLVPADPTTDSGAFGVRRASAIAGVAASTIPSRAAAPAVSFFHAQGARAEMKTAVYEALAAAASSTPPGEIAIVVRSFRPYVAALDELFDRGEVAWHTSYTRPLLRDAAAAKGLRAIACGGDSGRKRFGEHAAEFEALADAAGAGSALAGLLQSMRDVEDLLGDRRPVGRAEAHAWLASRAAVAQVPPPSADGGGIRILDAMQARGLTFSHVQLAGMNAGLFPHIAREHPFLSDRSKARLAEAAGSSLPVAAERDGEEKLLLAMTLRSAGGRVTVSWQRADEEARPVSPSLALGEVTAFAGIGDSARDAERAARPIPAHPRARFGAWVRSTELLDRRDERTYAALSSEIGADAGPAIVSRAPEWSAGVALVAATESFERIPGRYDGRIGRSVLSDSMAATALERLAWCPLRFFFRDVLRIQDARRLGEFESDRRETGIRVHTTLCAVYDRLRDEGAFGSVDLPARIVRAREILREAWSASAGDESAARAARVPVLDRIETQAWLQTLDAFLREDLTRMAALDAAPERTEDTVVGVIPGLAADFAVKVRLDRVVAGKEGRIVGDYKTGGAKLADRLSAGEILSGASLQAPIYTLLTSSPVELLGVGPKNVGQVARFDALTPGDVRSGVLETIGAALSLAASGRFPIHPGDHCERCAYRSACRHGHPPTVFREAHAADVEDARDCWSKTKQLPSLDAVRRARA